MKFTLSSRQTANAARQDSVEYLCDLLREDEGSLITILDAMEPRQRLQAVRPAVARNLLAQALENDQPRALMRLREMDTSRRPWQQSSYTDQELAKYARRAHPPKLSVALFQQGLLDANDCVVALRQASQQDFINLVRTGTINALVATAVEQRESPLDAAVLQELLARGAIPTRLYCALRAPHQSEEQVDALLVDHAAGLINTVELLSHINPSAAQAVQWVVDGRINVASLIESGNNLTPDIIRNLYEAGYVDRALYVEAGAATQEEVIAWLNAEEIDAQQAAHVYRLPSELLTDLLQSERIYAATYIRAAARSWEAGDDLPVTHVAAVRDAVDINAVLRGLPKPTNNALRRSFLVRLYAEHIEATAIAPRGFALAPRLLMNVATTSASVGVRAAQGLFRGVLERLLNLVWAPAPAHDPPPQVVRECLACSDTLDDDNVAVSLSGCAHHGQFCQDCVRQTFDADIDRGVPPTCPSIDCRRPFSLSDGRELHLGPRQTDQLALAVVRAHRPPLFQACPTKDCCGGAVVNVMRRVQLDCAHCEVTTVFDNASELQGSLLDAITGMGTGGRMRSCYHCGLGTNKSEGCDAMTCGRDAHSTRGIAPGACGREWNFTTGQGNHAAAYLDGQCYVPRAGVLVTAGLFEPLAPGYVHRGGEVLPGGATSIQELVIRNAIDRGLIRRDRRGAISLVS